MRPARGAPAAGLSSRQPPGVAFTVVAGWGRGRARLLAFLAVVALALAFGRPSAGTAAPADDGRGAVYAAGLVIGPESATVRTLDEGGPRRWPDGRPGRQPLGLLLTVLAAAAIAAGAAGSRPLRERRLPRLCPQWLGGGSLAPRAPPVLVPAL